MAMKGFDHDNLHHLRFSDLAQRFAGPVSKVEVGPDATSWPKRSSSGLIPSAEFGETILAWAGRIGVADHLDEPLSALEPTLSASDICEIAGSRGADVTMRRYLSKQGTRTAYYYKWNPVEKAIADFCRRRAKEQVSVLRAAALAQMAFPSPEVERLVASLQTLQRELERQVQISQPFLVGSPIVRLERETAILDVVFSRDGNPTYAELCVRVGLWSDRPEEMFVECSCGGSFRRACVHSATAVGWVLDVLYDSREPAHEPVLSALTKWRRREVADVVSSVLQRRESAGERNERIVWRLSERSYGAVYVSAAMQKRNKKGSWSAGRGVPVAKLRRDEALACALDPLDEAVIDALFKAREPYRLERKEPVPVEGAIKALVGHPRVWTCGAAAKPVAVVKAQTGLALVPEGEDYRLSLQFGDEMWPVGRAVQGRRGSRILVRYEEDRGVCAVGELSELTLDMLESLKSVPSLLRKAQAVELLDAIGRAAVPVELKPPPELRGVSLAGDPRCHVVLSPHDDHLLLGVSLVARPLGDELAVKPGDGQAELVRGVRGVLTTAHRDLVAEARHAEDVAQALGLLERPTQDPWCWQTTSLDESLRVVEALGQLGDQVEVEWPKEAERWFVHRASRSELKVNVRKKGEWFAVSPVVSCDGQSIPLEMMIEAARQNRRYIKLGPQRFAVLEEHLRAVVLALDDMAAEGTTKELRLDALSAALLEDTAQRHGVSVDGDRAFAQLSQQRVELERFEPELPAGFTGELRDYQRQGVAWLTRLSQMGGGACLADDMGLGKTVQALALLLHRKQLGPGLVVAPTSVLSTWLTQARTFTPQLDLRLYHGPQRAAARNALGPGSVLVTSYDVLAMDIDELAEVSFGTFIIDEAQNVKNAATQRAKAARKVQAKARVALSGTPVENHLGELWSIFHVIAPGLLGSFERFRKRFAAPIEKGGDPERRQALARLLRPFVLRRTKAAVAPELPPRLEVIRTVELSEAEKVRYEAVRLEMVRRLLEVQSRDPKDRFQVLAAITRLRRLACHPRLDDPSTTIVSAKLEAVRELLGDLAGEGQRALVFSQFTSHLALLREALDEQRRPYLYLDGGTAAAVRARLVDEWATGQPDLFLISLRAGGTGLNLMGADYVLHLDPWWNPAVEDQATDRTHRIGQTKPVTVVRFISAGTIEESVVALHARKRELAAALLDGTEAAGTLSTMELMELILRSE